jgi:RNA polymerase-interacting CarD/CdnL/TRCF family regulator
MRLSEGTKVSYPLQGPCLIGPVVTKVVGGERAKFHHLIPLGDGGPEFFVPFGRAPVAGVRRLVTKSEISEVLDRLAQPPRPAANGKLRAHDHSRLFASGAALDLAELIALLTDIAGINRFNGDGLLEKARRLLAREIAEVLGESESAAEASIDDALAAGGRGRPRPKARSGV